MKIIPPHLLLGKKKQTIEIYSLPKKHTCFLFYCKRITFISLTISIYDKYLPPFEIELFFCFFQSSEK